MVVLVVLVIVYGIMSYINYRLVNKFTAEVPLWENFVPIWSTYILAKQAMSRPILVILAQYVPIAISLFVLLHDLNFSLPSQPPIDKIQEHQGLYDNLKMIYSVAVAYFWGEVANALGKKRWVHWIFALLQFPLVISVPIMAFDKSQPVSKVD